MVTKFTFSWFVKHVVASYIVRNTLPYCISRPLVVA